MLYGKMKGYAVMDKQLTGWTFENESLERCKRYCGADYVIVERLPIKIGFSIRIYYGKFWKPFSFKYGDKNILWIHWSISPEYSHKSGKVVYPINS